MHYTEIMDGSPVVLPLAGEKHDEQTPLTETNTDLKNIWPNDGPLMAPRDTTSYVTLVISSNLVLHETTPEHGHRIHDS